MIHATAIIDPAAQLADDVEVGPYSIIGPQVEIGAGTVIGPHAVISGPCRIGRGNRIFQFASVGEVPQDKKYAGEPTTLEIGDENVIREYVTLNRGTVTGLGKTVIGSGNLFMAYTHVAHDCIVGDHCVLRQLLPRSPGMSKWVITLFWADLSWCTSLPRSGHARFVVLDPSLPRIYHHFRQPPEIVRN